MEFASKHPIITGAGALLAIFLVARAGSKSAGQSKADEYAGPSILSGPGPAIIDSSGAYGSAPIAGAANDSGGVDLAAAFAAQIEQSRVDAQTAQRAALASTNVDLIGEFLTRVGAKQLKNQTIALDYNDQGQVNQFGIGDKLKPANLTKKANDISAAVAKLVKSGFTRAEALQQLGQPIPAKAA